jgi:hypothetical protein
MPGLGGAPRASNVFGNECNFMKVPDDMSNPMDDSPTIAVDTGNDFRRNSDPTSGTSNQPNWVPLPDHSPTDQGQDVQRTMQGLALGSMPRPTYGPGDLSSGGYVNSESSNNDTGLSPNTGNSGSDRPTPNSTTPSEPRTNLQPGQTSGGTSYETSPASSHAARVPTAPDTRSMASFFSTQPDYSNIPATGMTPDNNAFTMPETPGREFQVPPGWEMSGQTTGLTPVGEGVFRQLMGLGPMDPMDLGWEGGS